MLQSIVRNPQEYADVKRVDNVLRVIGSFKVDLTNHTHLPDSNIIKIHLKDPILFDPSLPILFPSLASQSFQSNVVDPRPVTALPSVR